MKKIVKIVLALLIVALIVFAALRLLKARQASEAATPPAKEYAVRIETTRLHRGPVRLSLPAIATSRNDRDSTVASKISGRILQIRHSGERVRKGEVLVRLDDASIRARLEAIEHAIASARQELEAAQISLKNLQRIHRRSAELLKVQGMSQEQFEAEAVKIAQAQAKIEAIRSQIAKLQADRASSLDQLSYAVITAPTDGVVSASLASVGDLAMPGKALLKLSALQGSYLLVRLPRPARSIRFRGRRIALKPLYRTDHGLLEYRADLPGYLPSDTRVGIEVEVYEGEEVFLPQDTLLDREGKSYILRMRQGRPVAQEVSILARGQEGAVSGDARLDGAEVVRAKPDILLRLLGGYPAVMIRSGE